MTALNHEIGKMLGAMIKSPDKFLLTPDSCPLTPEKRTVVPERGISQ
jgi:hypothetical protein